MRSPMKSKTMKSTAAKTLVLLTAAFALLSANACSSYFASFKLS